MNWKVICSVEDLREARRKCGDMVRVLTITGKTDTIESAKLGSAVAAGFVLAVEIA